jgi:hypothetical protein
MFALATPMFALAASMFALATPMFALATPMFIHLFIQLYYILWTKTLHDKELTKTFVFSGYETNSF